MMTNQEMLEIAMAQSATDLGCSAEDFRRSDPVLMLSKPDPAARRYLKLPFSCQMAHYGQNLVASVSPECAAAAEAYLAETSTAHCFETPGIYRLNDLLRPQGQAVCFMAEYWLPDAGNLKLLPCPYPTRLLGPEDFRALYTPEWSNALCETRKELDILGVGAYDGSRLIGLAACSMDCETMWQIGIDVLPEYRRRGIASALTAALTQEILLRDKVPFYCCAWCNLPSARNAIRSGFRPVWAEMTAKSLDFIDRMNDPAPTA